MKPIAASASLCDAAALLTRSTGLLPVVDDDGKAIGFIDRATLSRTMLSAGTTTMMFQQAGMAARP